MGEDPLVLLPMEKWSELEEVLAKDWPNSIQMEMLDIHRKWTKMGIKHNLKVYCPYGDVNNGMVATNKKETYYDLLVLCPKKDTSEMELALRTTKHIDWKEELICLLFATDNIVELFERVLNFVSSNKKLVRVDLELYVIRQGSQKFDLRIPAGLSFGPVNVKNAEYINSVWPHRDQYPNSTPYFADLIKANMSYGLYKDQELIGWVFVRENGPLGHLYIKEAHRRKGYGSLILKYITNVLLNRNKHCFAYCVVGNDSGSAMYRKLNFKKEGLVSFIFFTPKEQPQK